MKTKQIIVSALFVAMLAVGAKVRIPIAIIPITLQPICMLLCGLLQDRKYALLSIGLYMFMGLLGFPVFANGGGLSYILQPSFGYLLGFVVSIFLVSTLKKT